MNDTEQAQQPGSAPMPDWGVGHYESTASQLLPAASAVVEAAQLQPGERVLDVGCGTGNAALLAVEHGTEVMGVDPAARLLDVARARAEDEGKRVTFERGEAASLPVGDGSVDVVLSVFGVVFAPDPGAAAAEIARVLAPTGRVVLSAWIPGGAMSNMNEAAAEAVRQAIGMPAPPPKPFAWHDRDALAALFGSHSFAVKVAEHALVFTGSSAEDYLGSETTNHPLAVAGYRVLEQYGQADTVFARLLRILEDGNEVRDGFQVTSRYVIASACRSFGKDVAAGSESID